MKVFISWSGEVSHEIACVFRDWLPDVIQSIKPYVSSENIDKGTRWSSDIASELELSSYGIIIITKDNLNAPWINFEAGALSKSLDKSNVSPFLFNVKRSEVQGPLLQFQSTLFEKPDVLKLIQSINKRLEEGRKLDEPQLLKSFEAWWNKLETNLKSVKVEILEKDKSNNNLKVNESEILEEILELVRNQQKILNSPENILPERYLENVLSLLHDSNVILSSNVLSRVNSLYNIIIELRECSRKALDQTTGANSLEQSNAREIYLLTEQLQIKVEDWNSELKSLERQRIAKMRSKRILPEF